MTLQEIIATLQAYWSARGCLIHQPWDSEVGAGTMHPETFLRVLGPKPWRVKFRAPSLVAPAAAAVGLPGRDAERTGRRPGQERDEADADRTAFSPRLARTRCGIEQRRTTASK